MLPSFSKAALALLLLGTLPSCLSDSHGEANVQRAADSAAYSYSWTGKEDEKNKGLANGTYNVVVTDANGATSNEPVAANIAAPPPPPAEAQVKPQAKMPDMIIKTGSLDIEVEDYKKSRGAVDEAVRAQGGYIQHEDENGDHYAIRNNISIRVPTNNFDKLMNGLSGIAKEVRGRTVNMADVSEEYYDLEARKKAQQAAAQRYIDLLKQAKTVSEVMEIQAKIDEIQESIEAKEGRIRYLADQVSYSTITLNMTKNYEYTPTDSPNFLSRLGSAFGNGWQGVLHFLVGIVQLWPLWLVVLAIVWGLRRLIKRWRKKSAPEAQAV